MTTSKKMFLSLSAIVLVVAGAAGPSSAGVRFEAVYSSEPVDVRVWMDRGYGYEDWDGDDSWDYYDVYPSVDDVVLYVRAAQNCFTTVYIIDTEGFIHVVYPLSPYDDAYLTGGRVHRFHLGNYGFHGGCFGRGVAFAFAVSSPVPFGYADYGMTVFGPHVGFQVYGDPFVAARLFYLSILPPAYSPSFAGVSYARFYVNEYMRYPSYLCPGWHEHHGARTQCDGQCGAHRDYRIHAKDPFRVLRPAGSPERETVRYTKIERTGAKDFGDVRVRTTAASSRTEPVVRDKGPAAERRSVRLASGASKDRSTERVVRSTRDEFVASKRNYEKMREVYDKSGETNGTELKQRSVTKSPVIAKTTKVTTRSANGARETAKVTARAADGKRETDRVATRASSGARETAKVTKRAPDGARETVALRSAPVKEASKSGKGAKRTRS